jgi:hypothetical protein
MAPSKHKMPSVKQKKAPRYTPVSKRQDKPDAVYWILRNHPEFTDADIIKLIGTTKATIQKIRERSHWNATNIKAVDPVTLGLCSQLELDLAVERASVRRERLIKECKKYNYRCRDNAGEYADVGSSKRHGSQNENGNGRDIACFAYHATTQLNAVEGLDVETRTLDDFTNIWHGVPVVRKTEPKGDSATGSFDYSTIVLRPCCIAPVSEK